MDTRARVPAQADGKAKAKRDGLLVSVLTPSLNQARFLGDCISSVAAQTHRPIEHVICDGRSADGTFELLRRAPEHVRWVSEPDRGQAHALNKGLELSRGQIIGWVNSDDAYADRRAVSWAVEAFQKDRRLEVVFGQALLVNESNTVLQMLWAPPFMRSLVRLVHYVSQPTLFIRREVLERQAFFLREDLDAVFDRELLLRLAPEARVHRLGRVLAVDRHQRERKVESAAFLEEAARFDASLGIVPTRARAALARGVKIALRLTGAVRMLTLPTQVDPALELHWPSSRDRIRLQIATPRRQMPF